MRRKLCSSASEWFSGRIRSRSGTILVMPLVLCVYFCIRHVCDAHQILVWHRKEIDSAGKMIQLIMERMIIGLLISQFATMFKVLIGNNFHPVAIIFFLLLIGGTVIFMSFLMVKPLIRPELFPETEFKVDSTSMEHWWNTYSHPLIVKVGTGLNTTTAQQLFGNKDGFLQLSNENSSNLPSRGVYTEQIRPNTEGANYQTEEIERKRRERQRDEMMQSLSKQQSIGARSKKAKKKTAVDELNKRPKPRSPNDPPEAKAIQVDINALRDAELRRYFEQKSL